MKEKHYMNYRITKTIIIQEAEKGSCIVIMERDYYQTKTDVTDRIKNGKDIHYLLTMILH